MRSCYLIAVGLLLAGCATSADVPLALSRPVDQAVQQQAHEAQLHALPLLGTGKLKFTGPVTIQLGGAGNVASATDVGRARGALATAPHAAATAPTPAAGPPWWLWPAVAAAALAAGLLVGWRARATRRVPGPE